MSETREPYRDREGAVKAFTARGFRIYDQWRDSYDNEITVQESSNIVGGVWVYIKKADEPTEDWAAHLNHADTKRLISALEDAIDHQGDVFGPDMTDG
jgi:hypothetical protein